MYVDCESKAYVPGCAGAVLFEEPGLGIGAGCLQPIQRGVAELMVSNDAAHGSKILPVVTFSVAWTEFMAATVEAADTRESCYWSHAY
jgi:hypothetical protein